MLVGTWWLVWVSGGRKWVLGSYLTQPLTLLYLGNQNPSKNDILV